MSIFILSDIHIDYQSNWKWILNLSDHDFRQDTLILAGDVTDQMTRLAVALETLNQKFKHVFYVPGNHELWVKDKKHQHSIEKFEDILQLCDKLEIHTKPKKILPASGNSVWIIPLFSWYVQPEEGDGGLYLETEYDLGAKIWSDHFYTQWPENITKPIADYFLKLNEAYLDENYDAPIISFSHFLPRHEVMFPNQEVYVARKQLKKSMPLGMNFSRIAGCVGLEKQIRRLNSKIHVYGHQHRNWEWHLDHTNYLSHCLGYPREREKNLIGEIDQGPRLIWK